MEDRSINPPCTTMTFSVEEISQIRAKARKAAELPGDVPQGWSKSKVDPMSVLAAFTPLQIRDGFVLRAYQFRVDDNGNGMVWAMPEDAVIPDPNNCCGSSDKFPGAPKPDSALPDVMDAINGDDSHWSYLCASIFAREICEFGALWHGCDWCTHRILGEEPWREFDAPPKSEAEDIAPPVKYVEWFMPKPANWEPTVSKTSRQIVVTFFTLSELGGGMIYRHTDIFSPDTYRFESEGTAVARGPGGFVW